MDEQLARRFADLAARADRTGRFTFTDFLTEAEFAEYCAVKNQLACRASADGGHPDAERLMLRFGDPEQLGYEEPYPIACVQIAPVQEKFAETLSHRDYLGALMHLGIERAQIGDILVHEKEAFVFCRAAMADYICSLERIRHTSVQCSLTEALPPALEAHTEHLTVQCASLRIDGVIAKLFHISRGDCNVLFRAGKVFVGGAAVSSNSLMLRPGDTVSVRGYGKFRFCGQEGETRKGNLILGIDRFV